MAKITGIYCSGRDWRIETELIDFKLLNPKWRDDERGWGGDFLGYSQDKIVISLSGHPDHIRFGIIRNHTQLQRASGSAGGGKKKSKKRGSKSKRRKNSKRKSKRKYTKRRR